MQNEGMRKLLADSPSPMQTDSVHSFVYFDADAKETELLYEPKHQTLQLDEEINITFTSMFDKVLGRTVPVLVSILFNKTTNNYKSHFLQLFKGIPEENIEEFEETFKGTTADMSAAELAGKPD